MTKIAFDRAPRSGLKIWHILAVQAVIFALIVAFWATAGYVAWHFISKWW